MADEKTLAEQYADALKDGPVIMSVPGELLHGFKDLGAALAYVEAKNAAAGIGKEMKVLAVTGDAVKKMLDLIEEEKRRSDDMGGQGGRPVSPSNS